MTPQEMQLLEAVETDTSFDLDVPDSKSKKRKKREFRKLRKKYPDIAKRYPLHGTVFLMREIEREGSVIAEILWQQQLLFETTFDSWESDTTVDHKTSHEEIEHEWKCLVDDGIAEIIDENERYMHARLSRYGENPMPTLNNDL